MMKPTESLSAVQLELKAAYNALNGVLSDLHYLVEDSSHEECHEGFHQWSEDWLPKIATAKQAIIKAETAWNKEREAAKQS